MNISYNWISTYVDHGLPVDDLAHALTMSGLEVEDVAQIGANLDGVVVGHVLDARPHPNADRLRVCRVEVGDGEPVQIVCGAPNVAAGQKVPVATVGTTLMLPDRKDPATRVPVKIKKAKLRGEVSQGMICAEDELGLGHDHSGIMVLPAEAPVGQPFAAYLEAQGVPSSDAVIDLAITPNRPDATSHIGVARDVAALTDQPLVRPEVALPAEGGQAAELVTVQLEAPKACPRYVALVVKNVTIKESPAWLKARLEAIGLRPRNNIVDITNYVMHECGQPLHAFDLGEIAGSTIRVRLTDADELFTTLDSVERKLPAGTLMIADAERDVAIAGVMGGENSEVTDATTDVLIESAYFDPSTIRRTAKALQLQTDASYRFERGVDRDGQVWAAARAAALMVEVADGELVPGMVDAHPVKPELRRITLRPLRVEQILGVEIPLGDIERLLTAIGFAWEETNLLEDYVSQALEGRAFRLTSGDGLQVIVPTFRPDVEREIDVIEEVARLYGFDNIPEPDHAEVPFQPPRLLPAALLRNRVRARLAGLGFREVYTNSLLSRPEAEGFATPGVTGREADVVETLNPISREMAALRPSLLPGVLDVMRYNQNRGQEALRFVEFGHVIRKADDGEATIVAGYAEHESVLIALSGPAATNSWSAEARDADFFDLKGQVHHLLDWLHIDVAAEVEADEDAVAPHRLVLRADGERLGVMAQVSAATAEAFDLRRPVYFAELDFDVLTRLATGDGVRPYAPISRFPEIERDLALLVSAATPAGDLLGTIRDAAGDLLRDVDVFDVYEGDRIEAGQKSVAFALRFGADRTLKDKDVDARITAVTQALAREHGAVLRA